MYFPVEGRITAGFNDLRPLSAVPEKRNHVHGAVDIAAPVNTPIFAPEDGVLYVANIVRNDVNRFWDEMKWMDNESFPFQNYFDDIYGSLILLIGSETGYFHLFCHSWWNQIYNKHVIDRYLIVYQEEKKESRFPIRSYHNLDLPTNVKKEDCIGYVGNAGFSTGPHVHYEIHNNKFQKYEDRIDPAELYSLKVD